MHALFSSQRQTSTLISSLVIPVDPDENEEPSVVSAVAVVGKYTESSVGCAAEVMG